MFQRTCVVTYTDGEKISHSVKVHADSLFEAAIRGLSRLDDSFWNDGSSILERLGSVTVEAYEEPTKHEVPIKKLKQWLESGSRNPREESKKADLRKLFQGTK